MRLMTAAISVDELAMRTEDLIPFDQYGRYLIVPQGAKKPVGHTRVTTFSSTLDDRYGLEKWGLRMSALGFVARQDLYAQLCSTRPDDKHALDKLCDKAKEAAAASAGANMGTALHAMCERVDLGEDVTFPAPFDADVKAYQQALNAAGIVIIPDMVERYVVLPELQLGGKLDRIIDFGSQPKIADLKTGADLAYSWGTIAVQLACYANAATLYNGKTQTHEPMPDVDKDTALVIHLPAGKATCSLYFVDIAAGWEAAQHAAWVRQWRKRRDLADPWRPGTCLDSLIERRAGIVERLATLKATNPAAYTELARQWPKDIPTLKQSQAHSADQLSTIDTLLCAIEDRYQAPFGPVDPNHNASLKEPA
jgi:hypothetical protein